MSFTNPLKNLGTFFTTIVIFYTLLYFYCNFQQEIQAIPTATTISPIINSQPENGSNITSSTPSPNPIKHTANVFLNNLNIITS